MHTSSYGWFLLVTCSLAIGAGSGCTRPHPPSATDHAGSAAPGSIQPASASPHHSAPGASPASSHVNGAVPVTSASVHPAASSSVAPPASSSAPSAASEPLPDVEVKNIGMHIGGGPNDRESKAPIARSVRPHFDEFRACWRYVEDPSKGGTFGVDLLIPRKGGKAKASHPRSGIEGERFVRCMIDVFERIDFLRPKTGRTMVSYSLRFTPKGKK